MVTADLFPPAIERSAAISRCGRYRWQLVRRWSPGAPVLFCMLNPSTADGAPKHPLARGRHRVPASAQPIIWQPRDA